MIDDKKNKKKTKIEVIDEKNSIIHYIFLSIAYITFIAYLVLDIKNISDITKSIPTLIGWVFILLLLISFTIICFKNKKNNVKGIVCIGSILIICYSVINILLSTNIISLPKDDYVPNFYNQSSLEVTKWKNENKITVNENYEYSDTIKKDYVISQDISAPTLTKDVKELTITISLGPDPNKEIIIPNFIGLKYDEVIKYIEDNHLSNVEIEYQKSEKTPDTVISQSKSGTLKRSDEITITFAISTNETGEVEIVDFTGKTKLYATSWLEKFGFKIEIKEDYSDDIEEGSVLEQSAKNEVKNPEEDTITLTISKGKKVLAPDIASMNTEEINKWAIENNVKISYKEEYSDDKKLGDVISSSIEEGQLVEKEKKVEITISKGKLEMIKLTTVNEFTNWAETNKISYDINYENSDSVKKDDIIKCSHETGQVIKKDDTIVVTVSRGKVITIPNFVGMSKSDISSKCSSINLSCSFKNGGYTESTKKDIAISQSKKANTKVSEGTGITITLSAGIQEKVDVPSFVGKTKSNIESSCKNIGIKCTFKYGSGYNSQAKDTCLKQSITGKVNKGSTVTITLSNGPAKTYTVVIQADWLSWGNPSATKATLESKLKANCPGVTFNFSYKKVNSGIGYLNPESKVKVGSNTFVQGQSYSVIINSN